MTRKIEYETSGTCSRSITVILEDDVIKSVEFCGGCPGNTTGLSALAVGRTPAEIKDKLKGIDCKDRGTSCPDQLALALETLI